MTDYTHFQVLHKSSGKVVSIFQMTTDASWVGKEHDELIALPIDTPEGVDEIKMSFTPRFSRYKGTPQEQNVSPFFKRAAGQPETLSETKRKIGGESKAHKLAKEQIYTGLLNETLKINGKTAKELGAKDLALEEHSDSGHAIADIFVKFDNDPKYKRGICIEIQFSSQNEEKTKERTLSRLREGWCVIWLWREDFKEGILIKDNLEVKAHEEYLKELREDEYEKFLKRMNDIGGLIDEKLNHSIQKYNENSARINRIYRKEWEGYLNDWRGESGEQFDFIKNQEKNYSKTLESMNNRLEELDDLIRQSDNVIKFRKEKLLDEINKKQFEIDAHHTELVVRFKNIVNNVQAKEDFKKELEKWLSSKVEEYKTKILLVHQNEELNRRIKEIESKKEVTEDNGD